MNNSGFASNQIDKVTDTVFSKLDTIRGWANTARNTAESAIDSMDVFEIPKINLQFPSMLSVDQPEDPNVGDLPSPVVNTSTQTAGFSPIGRIDMTDPEVIPDPVYGNVVKPTARPSITIPTAPQPSYVGAPDRPSAPNLAKPVAPTITPGSAPTLLAIDIPEFSFGTIDSFTGVIPEFTPYELRVNPSVKLTEYSPDELSARIQALMPSELPDDLIAMSKRMSDELVGMVDKETMKLTNDSFIKWASLNFSMTPGMLVDEINDIQTAGGQKIREGQAKLNDEFFKFTLDRFKTAISQGIALEKHMADLYVEEVRQLIEIEKLKVKAAIAAFESTVAAFNSHQSARAAYAAAYKAELDANMKIVASYAPLVEGAIAEIAENEVRVQMFNSDVKLQNVSVDVYKKSVDVIGADIEAYVASLTGVKAEADIIAANIEAYRDAVKAYSAGVNMTASEFEAYAAEVQAAASGVVVDESNIRAYAAYVQENAKRAGAYKAYVSGQSEVLRAELNAFQEAASANEGYARATAAKAAAKAEIGQAMVSAFSNQIKAYTDYNKALAQSNAVMTSFNLVAAENEIRAKMFDIQAQAETDKVRAGAEAARAQATVGLAQGSMSALHVQASSQGSGTTAYGANFNYGVSSSWGGSTDKTESKRQIINA